MRRWPRLALVEAAALWFAAFAPAAGVEESWRLGGDVRAWQFMRVDGAAGRPAAELAVARLKLDGRLSDSLSTETHGVLSIASPRSPASGSIASGTTRHLLPLEEDLVARDDVAVIVELDRLNVRWERSSLTFVAGRQAITWGVNMFWPVLDLFAPFPPERIDREYKPGVDAVRLRLALSDLSEIELVAAGQGRSVENDGSVGAIGRVHLGPADLGLMVGRFHRDVVAGGFVTANIRGTGLRAEIAATDSGDPADKALGHAQFWRGGVGLDRQLTTTLSLTAEVAWNGFGASSPSGYVRVADADRVRRGEVNSLGRLYGGGTLSWQAHPLLALAGTVLVNLGDPSALLLPHADWSVSDSVTLVFGGIAGVGAGRRSNRQPGSEYGSVPETVYLAIKLYF